MRKLAVVAESSVVKTEAQPEDFKFLVPLSCGYLTGAITILDVLNTRPTEKLAVQGVGAVGLADLVTTKAVGVETL
ncbi:hypothetical protein F1880_009469 [Penicillium rolfsii]|nr:hypothetical protein F1880_009469 [Penicillium rolfsii]